MRKPFTILRGNLANKGNCRNCTQRTESLVICSNTGVLSRKCRIHRHLLETAVMESLPLCQFNGKIGVQFLLNGTVDLQVAAWSASGLSGIAANKTVLGLILGTQPLLCTNLPVPLLRTGRQILLHQGQKRFCRNLTSSNHVSSQPKPPFEGSCLAEHKDCSRSLSSTVVPR